MKPVTTFALVLTSLVCYASLAQPSQNDSTSPEDESTQLPPEAGVVEFPISTPHFALKAGDHGVGDRVTLVGVNFIKEFFDGRILHRHGLVDHWFPDVEVVKLAKSGRPDAPLTVSVRFSEEQFREWTSSTRNDQYVLTQPRTERPRYFDSDLLVSQMMPQPDAADEEPGSETLIQVPVKPPHFAFTVGDKVGLAALQSVARSYDGQFETSTVLRFQHQDAEVYAIGSTPEGMLLLTLGLGDAEAVKAFLAVQNDPEIHNLRYVLGQKSQDDAETQERPEAVVPAGADGLVPREPDSLREELRGLHDDVRKLIKLLEARLPQDAATAQRVGHINPREVVGLPQTD